MPVETALTSSLPGNAGYIIVNDLVAGRTGIAQLTLGKETPLQLGTPGGVAQVHVAIAEALGNLAIGQATRRRPAGSA